MKIIEVKKGDTLAGLALLHSATTESISAVNRVNTARQGERLLIEPIDGMQYVVRPFDTREKIARACRVNIARVNAAAGGEPLYPGRILYL
ncbi:MAG: LysM peptidoglycan-binding domain-containing protein [Clostridiales bacterium]|nr:LysM peptidoglycan-binding domain-containing protein [Clostridiales bacterium]